MDKIKNIIISYWFQELKINPKEKLSVLEQELSSVFDMPFMYNDENINHLISMPRVQVMTKDQKKLFQISLINANLSVNVADLDNDEVVLLINNYAQLFYDVIKNTFDTTIYYLSIKLEIVEDRKNCAKTLASRFFDDNLDYEDFSIKRGFVKDDYYINYILSSSRQFNFNVAKNENGLEQDVFDRTMITSLSCAELKSEFILKVIEINDRYAYNLDSNYQTSKDAVRGMIIEIKHILENKLYEKEK